MNKNARKLLGLGVGASALCAAEAAVLPATPAGATHDGYHAYSIAYEKYPYSSYTLLQSISQDVVIPGIQNDGCGVPYSGHPVYQTSWVMINTEQTTWFEVGRGHQCSDNYRYHFWGFGFNGGWFPQGSEQLFDRTSHSFTIFRNNGVTWTWKIDAGARGNQSCSCIGIRESVGLESYASAANVPRYDHNTLKFGVNEGQAQWWAGRDDSFVSPGMCGGWNSDTSWWATENNCG